MNKRIKHAIIESGLKGYEVARANDWTSSKLSSIINGSYIPSSLEKEDLAKALGTTVEILFDHKEGIVA